MKYPSRTIKEIIQKSGIAQKLLREGSITKQQIADKFDYYGDKCWICKAAPAISLDHIIPSTLRGKDLIANIKPCCRNCNGAKGSTYPLDIEKLREKVRDRYRCAMVSEDSWFRVFRPTEVEVIDLFKWRSRNYEPDVTVSCFKMVFRNHIWSYEFQYHFYEARN